MSRWVGKFPSLKLNRMVGYQSLIERDFIYLLDFDPAVSTYCEQPFAIRYTTDGKRRRYTPDFSLTYNQQQLLIECKHHQYMQLAENIPKWRAASDWCSAHEATFYVITEQMMRHGCYLANVKRLTQSARYIVPPQTKTKIHSLLQANSAMSIGELTTLLQPQSPATILTAILHSAYHQFLWIPLSVPITPDSIITLRRSHPSQTSLLKLLS